MTIVDIHQRSYDFSVKVIKIVRSVPYRYDTSIIVKQLLRSSTSVGANIIEAQNSATKGIFLQYLGISLRSARESEYWLKLCLECNLIENNIGQRLLNECKEIAKIIAAIRLKGLK